MPQYGLGHNGNGQLAAAALGEDMEVLVSLRIMQQLLQLLDNLLCLPHRQIELNLRQSSDSIRFQHPHRDPPPTILCAPDHGLVREPCIPPRGQDACLPRTR